MPEELHSQIDSEKQKLELLDQEQDDRIFLNEEEYADAVLDQVTDFQSFLRESDVPEEIQEQQLADLLQFLKHGYQEADQAGELDIDEGGEYFLTQESQVQMAAVLDELSADLTQNVAEFRGAVDTLKQDLSTRYEVKRGDWLSGIITKKFGIKRDENPKKFFATIKFLQEKRQNPGSVLVMNEGKYEWTPGNPRPDRLEVGEYIDLTGINEVGEGTKEDVEWYLGQSIISASDKKIIRGELAAQEQRDAAAIAPPPPEDEADEIEQAAPALDPPTAPTLDLPDGADFNLPDLPPIPDEGEALPTDSSEVAWEIGDGGIPQEGVEGSTWDYPEEEAKPPPQSVDQINSYQEQIVALPALDAYQDALITFVDQFQADAATTRAELSDVTLVDTSLARVSIALEEIITVAQEEPLDESKLTQLVSDLGLRVSHHYLEGMSSMAEFDAQVEATQGRVTEGDQMMTDMVEGLDASWPLDRKESYLAEKSEGIFTIFRDIHYELNQFLMPETLQYLTPEQHEAVLQTQEELRSRAYQLEELKATIILHKTAEKYALYVKVGTVQLGPSEEDSGLGLIFTDEFRALSEEERIEISEAIGVEVNIESSLLSVDIEMSPPYEIPFHEGKEALASGNIPTAKAHLLHYLETMQGLSGMSEANNSDMGGVLERQAGNIEQAKELLKQIGLQQVAEMQGYVYKMRMSLALSMQGSFATKRKLDRISALVESDLNAMDQVLSYSQKWLEEGKILTYEQARDSFLAKRGDGHSSTFGLTGEARDMALLGDHFKKIEGDILDVFQLYETLNSTEDPGQKKQLLLDTARQYREKGLYEFAAMLFDEYFSDDYQALMAEKPELTREYFEEQFKTNSEFVSKFEEEFEIYKEDFIKTNIEEQKKDWEEEHPKEPFDEVAARAEFEESLTDDKVRLLKDQKMNQMIDERWEKALKTEMCTYMKGREGGDVWSEEFNEMMEFDASWYELWRFTDEDWDHFMQTLPIDLAMMVLSFGAASAAEKQVAKSVLSRVIVKEMAKEVGEQAAKEILEEAVKKGGKKALKELMEEMVERGIMKQSTRYMALAAAGSLGFMAENTAFVATHDALNATRTGKFHALASPKAFAVEFGRSALTLGTLKGVGAGYGAAFGTLGRTEAQILARQAQGLRGAAAGLGVEAAHWTAMNTAQVVALSGTGLLEQCVISGHPMTEQQIAGMLRQNVAMTIAFSAIHGTGAKMKPKRSYEVPSRQLAQQTFDRFMTESTRVRRTQGRQSLTAEVSARRVAGAREVLTQQIQVGDTLVVERGEGRPPLELEVIRITDKGSIVTREKSTTKRGKETTRDREWELVEGENGQLGFKKTTSDVVHPAEKITRRRAEIASREIVLEPGLREAFGRVTENLTELSGQMGEALSKKIGEIPVEKIGEWGRNLRSVYETLNSIKLEDTTAARSAMRRARELYGGARKKWQRLMKARVTASIGKFERDLSNYSNKPIERASESALRRDKQSLQENIDHLKGLENLSPDLELRRAEMIEKLEGQQRRIDEHLAEIDYFRDMVEWLDSWDSSWDSAPPDSLRAGIGTLDGFLGRLESRSNPTNQDVLGRRESLRKRFEGTRERAETLLREKGGQELLEMTDQQVESHVMTGLGSFEHVSLSALTPEALTRMSRSLRDYKRMMEYRTFEGRQALVERVAQQEGRITSHLHHARRVEPLRKHLEQMEGRSLEGLTVQEISDSLQALQRLRSEVFDHIEQNPELSARNDTLISRSRDLRARYYERMVELQQVKIDKLRESVETLETRDVESMGEEEVSQQRSKIMELELEYRSLESLDVQRNDIQRLRDRLESYQQRVDQRRLTLERGTEGRSDVDRILEGDYWNEQMSSSSAEQVITLRRQYESLARLKEIIDVVRNSARSEGSEVNRLWEEVESLRVEIRDSKVHSAQFERIFREVDNVFGNWEYTRGQVRRTSENLCAELGRVAEQAQGTENLQRGRDLQRKVEDFIADLERGDHSPRQLRENLEQLSREVLELGESVPDHNLNQTIESIRTEVDRLDYAETRAKDAIEELHLELDVFLEGEITTLRELSQELLESIDREVAEYREEVDLSHDVTQDFGELLEGLDQPSLERTESLRAKDLSGCNLDIGNLDSLISHYEAVIRGEQSLQTRAVTSDHNGRFARALDQASTPEQTTQVLERMIEHAKSQREALRERIGQLKPVALESANRDLDVAISTSEARGVDILGRNGEGATEYAQGLRRQARELQESYKPLIEESTVLQNKITLLFERARRFEQMGHNKEAARQLVGELYPEGIGSEIIQGEIGDCYLLASLKSLKGKPELMEQVISESIRQVGPHEWEVNFKGAPEAGPIRVSRRSVEIWRTNHSKIKASLGDVILERAYETLRQRLEGTGNVHILAPNNYSIEGGFGHRALHHLLGDHAVRYKVGGWESNTSHLSLRQEGKASAATKVLEEVAINPEELIVTANTPARQGGDNTTFYIDGQEMYFTHAYSVIGFDAVTRRVRLANPHNTARPFEITEAQFIEHFGQLSYVRVSDASVTISRLQSVDDVLIIDKSLDAMLAKNKGDIYQTFGLDKNYHSSYELQVAMDQMLASAPTNSNLQLLLYSKLQPLAKAEHLQLHYQGRQRFDSGRTVIFGG